MAVANVWGPSTYSLLQRGFPDCTRCRHRSSAELREVWGCDRAARRPVFEIGCSRCGGRDDECEDCSGTNRVPQHRCPSSIMAEADARSRTSCDLLLRAYVAYDSRNVLPVDGGFLDQSRSFVAACEIIDDERGRLERMKEAKREQDARAAQARSNRGNARRR